MDCQYLLTLHKSLHVMDRLKTEPRKQHYKDSKNAFAKCVLLRFTDLKSGRCFIPLDDYWSRRVRPVCPRWTTGFPPGGMQETHPSYSLLFKDEQYHGVIFRFPRPYGHRRRSTVISELQSCTPVLSPRTCSINFTESLNI